MLFDFFHRTHGFDSVGHEFDEIGNYVDWWQNDTKKTFKNKFKCLIKEYNAFVDTVSDLNSNGTATLNENIADNGNHLHELYEIISTYPNYLASITQKSMKFPRTLLTFSL